MISFRQFLSEAGYITHPRMNQAPWARPDWIPPSKVEASPEVQAYRASRMGTGLDATPGRTEDPQRGGFYPVGGRADQTRSNDPFQMQSMDMTRAERPRGTQAPFGDTSARIAHSQDSNAVPKKPLKQNTPTIGVAPQDVQTQGPTGTRNSFYSRRY